MKEIRCPYCDKIVVVKREKGVFSRSKRTEFKDDGKADLQCPKCGQFFSVEGFMLKQAG